MALTKMYWLHALTPVHVGAGTGVGFIDLPVMREKITNWPVVPGSAVKGVLADVHGAADAKNRSPKAKAAFGTGGDDHANSGSLVFTDARLVCLPLRSFYGTFAWATSAMALERLNRDLEAAGSLVGPRVAEGTQTLVAENSAVAPDNVAYVADLDFGTRVTSEATTWARKLGESLFPDAKDGWRTLFSQRFIILPENEFNTLAETGTEVAARVRLDEKQKTVAKGALWYEEYLPAETVLAGIVWCDRVFGANGQPSPEQLVHEYCTGIQQLQIGGKATTGKGRMRCIFGGNRA